MDAAAVLQTIGLLSCNALVAVLVALSQRRANEKDIQYMAILRSIEAALAAQASGLSEVKGHIATLYEWHDKEDSTGMKIWYMPRSFADMQKDIINTQNALVEVLRDLQRNGTEVGKLLEKQLDTSNLIHLELVKNNKDREYSHATIMDKLASLKEEADKAKKNS